MAFARAKKAGPGRSRIRRRRRAPKKEQADSKVLYVTAFKDPMREMDKLHSLYDTLMDARRQMWRRRRAVSSVCGAREGSGDEAPRHRKS